MRRPRPTVQAHAARPGKVTSRTTNIDEQKHRIGRLAHGRQRPQPFAPRTAYVRQNASMRNVQRTDAIRGRLPRVSGALARWLELI